MRQMDTPTLLHAPFYFRDADLGKAKARFEDRAELILNALMGDGLHDNDGSALVDAEGRVLSEEAQHSELEVYH